MKSRFADDGWKWFAALLGTVWLSVFVALPARAEWQRLQAGPNGLADNKVYCIHESRIGEMWFGTFNGASRYDGNAWHTYDDGNGLPNRWVTAIAEERDGTLWFATQNGGVARFDGQAWTAYSAQDGELPRNQIQKVLVDRNGEVWVATPGGLVRHSPTNGTWHTYTAADGSLVHPNATAIAEDTDGNLWVGSPAGVSRLDAARTLWEQIPPSPTTPDSVLAVAADSAGGVWFGTVKKVYRYADSQWTTFDASNSGLQNDTFITLSADRTGGMWVGGFYSLTHYDGLTWRSRAQTTDGTALNRILALLPDASGNLWVATQGASGALYRFDGEEYTSWSVTTFTGIAEDKQGEIWFSTGGNDGQVLNAAGSLIHASNTPMFALTVLADLDDNLWFGLPANGLLRLGPDRQSTTVFDAVLPGLRVGSVFQDSRGWIWAGTDSGAAVYDGTTWGRTLDGTGGLPVSEVRGFMEDQEGNLWFRTSTGLYRWTAPSGPALRVSAPDGPASDEVLTFLAARSGDLWFGTRRGLSRFNGQDWSTFPAIVDNSDTTVNAVFEDRVGTIWAGTRQGVGRWDGTGWETFGFSVLNAKNVIGIFQDRAGTIWLSLDNNGLIRTNGRTWQRIRTLDGLASDTVTRFLEDRRGHLWFAGLSNVGVTEYSPDRAAPQTAFITTPAPLIPIRTAPFTYGAGYGEGADIEYQTLLDGAVISDWSSDVASQPEDLPDGPHVFEVRARDWVGNVDPTPARFSFEVDATPPPAVISSPVFGGVVSGDVTVVGSAADPRFKDYRVEIRPSRDGPWTGPDIVTLATGSDPVVNGSLAVWRTEDFPEGPYDLRLIVDDAIGLSGIFPIQVRVDNRPPYDAVTAPATVSSAVGGDVFSLNGELHLYFPPKAFTRDATVDIQPATEAPPAQLDEGIVGIEPAWEVGWGTSELRKAATLDFTLPDTLTVSGTRALYRLNADGTTWDRLGGTPAGNTLSLSLPAAGVVALFVETAGTGPGPTGTPMARLVLTPRILSVTQAIGEPQVSISFTLSRPGPARVCIFNRAGRLMRTIVDGSLPAGDNLVRWGGQGDDGTRVPDDLYLVTVEAEGKTLTSTLAVVR